MYRYHRISLKDLVNDNPKDHLIFVNNLFNLIDYNVYSIHSKIHISMLFIKTYLHLYDFMK